MFLITPLSRAHCVCLASHFYQRNDHRENISALEETHAAWARASSGISKNKRETRAHRSHVCLDKAISTFAATLITARELL